MRTERLRYSESRVAHLEAYPLIVFNCTDLDFSSRPVVLNCVAYQIAYKHVEAYAVSKHPWKLRRYFGAQY